MLNYYLVDNTLTPDPNDARAVVQPGESVGPDEIVSRMVEQNTTISKPVMAAVLAQLPDVIGSYLSEGRNVNLPFANFRVTIQGKFDNMADSFDSSRHSISVSIAATPPIQDKVRSTGTTKVVQSAPAPILVQYEDMTSSTFNGNVTPGDFGKIVGLKLKVDTSKATDGIFFVPTGGGAEVKVTQIGNNKAGELLFKNPALPAGSYRLEVRVAYTMANVVRIGALDATLTVL